MFELKIAIRRLFHKGDFTLARILSLVAGLSFAILIFSEVLYYYSVNNFYPDSDRIYEVIEEINMLEDDNAKFTSYPRTSGAIGPGLKAEVPGIEAATRINSLSSSNFYTDEDKTYFAKFVLADECLFDVLPRSIIEGNAKEILSAPMMCMVSDKIAADMGGNVVGEIIEMKGHLGKKLTIGGVFEALPENSSYTYDILISMVSTGEFNWDGSNNWIGNDRYYTCVKLGPGVEISSLTAAVRQMQEKHQDISKLEKEQGIKLRYSFMSLEESYVSNVKNMVFILSAIGFLVLFVALMNYVLLTLNTLMKRMKSSAIYKACGAESAQLQRLIFLETTVLFLLALLGSILVILIIKPIFENYVEHQLSSAFTPSVIAPILGSIVVIIFLTSYLPGRYFSKVPISEAFRNAKLGRNRWKLGLLAIQFLGVSFVLSVLMVVTLQYDKLIESDHGYKVEGVYYGATNGMNPSKIDIILNELRAMPEIESIAMGNEVPLRGASGNNILSQDKTRNLFNVADFYYIDENYLSVLGLKCSLGSGFNSESTQKKDILISEKGADLLKLHNKWNTVLGETIEISELGGGQIRGVFPDFIINSLSDFDDRPAVFHYQSQNDFIKSQSKSPFKILVKVHKGMEQGITKKLTDLFNTAYHYNDANIRSLEQDKDQVYLPQLGFKSAMLAGNIVVVFVMLLGLIGYTSSEANRRAKELAIRRVNGASLNQIIWLFLKEVVRIAVPTIMFGLIGAWFISQQWMENFAQKVEIGSLQFILCSICILAFVLAISVFNYVRLANVNPVEYLKNDE